MLSLLRIENFALIDHLEVALKEGLMVLTGETGAGKSIILDALDLVLGGKATARMIRTSGDQGNQSPPKAFIEATFDLSPAVNNWLVSRDIDPLGDGTLVCSRELTVRNSGLRSRSRVNGVVLNQRLMAELRSLMVEITAQGQTMALLTADYQRTLLDSYGSSHLLRQRDVVKDIYQAYTKAKQAAERRRTSEQERLQRLDLLQYQLQELNDANLQSPNEEEQLQQDNERFSHGVELQQLGYLTHQLLYQNDDPENPAVADLLGTAEGHLKEMVDYDPQLKSILDMVSSALTEVVEASQQLSTYSNNLETNPEQLNEISERLKLLKQICRKYGSPLGEAIAHRDKLQAELESLTDADQSLESLEAEVQAQQEKLNEACQKLRELREKAARKLEKTLIKELKPLAMEKARFECQLFPIAPTTNGADRVTFFFSPNPGEVTQPLAEVASGGEMSRFLLALKACFIQQDTSSAKTLVFDEIDVGVSGKVAQAIATKLHQLSQQYQVLCVTHQPLVAAMADSHFRVSKQVQVKQKTPEAGDRTLVSIEILGDRESRRDELAQLTGGYVADEASAFVESLLEKAECLKTERKS